MVKLDIAALLCARKKSVYLGAFAGCCYYFAPVQSMKYSMDYLGEIDFFNPIVVETYTAYFGFRTLVRYD